MKKLLVTFAVLLFSCGAYAQKTETGHLLPAVIVDGDTLPLVKLQKVYVFPKLKFVTKEEYTSYRKLVRDVKKVYPYVIIARDTYREVQIIMDTLPNNKQRRKYIKAKESEMFELYAKDLMSMTVRQGEILIKLVSRELHKTPFEVLKELRGGFSATMWQGTAKIFGEDLKGTYDAENEDSMVERIVLQLEQGTL